jgi:hypothetical protein
MTIGKQCRNCFYSSTFITAEPCSSCKGFSKFVDARAFKDDAIDAYRYIVKTDVPQVTQPQTIKVEGVKFDNDKPQWSLMQWKALSQVVDVLTYGAKKYAPDNWKKVPNARQRYLDAGFRHFTAYAAGEKNDSETGLSHLAHAMCCLLFLLAFDLGEGNDTGNP